MTTSAEYDRGFSNGWNAAVKHLAKLATDHHAVLSTPEECHHFRRSAKQGPNYTTFLICADCGKDTGSIGPITAGPAR